MALSRFVRVLTHFDFEICVCVCVWDGSIMRPLKRVGYNQEIFYMFLVVVASQLVSQPRHLVICTCSKHPGDGF